MSEAKKRSANFSHEEKMKLVGLVRKHKQVILSKKTDKANNQRRDAVWRFVATSYNATGMTGRSVESLRKLWEKMKSAAKIHKTKLKENEMKTEDGRPYLVEDPILVQVIEMLDAEEMGIHNDGDADDLDDVGPSNCEPRSSEENALDSDFEEERLNNESEGNTVIFIDVDDSHVREGPGPPTGRRQNIIGSNTTQPVAGAQAPEWIKRRRPTIGTNERTSPTSLLYSTYEESQRERSKIEEVSLLAVEERREAREIHELKKQKLQEKIRLMKYMQNAAILDIEIKKETLRRMRSK